MDPVTDQDFQRRVAALETVPLLDVSEDWIAAATIPFLRLPEEVQTLPNVDERLDQLYLYRCAATLLNERRYVYAQVVEVEEGQTLDAVRATQHERAMLAFKRAHVRAGLDQ